MTPMSCSWQNGRISSSTPRRSRLYGGCSESIGPIDCARRSWSTLKFETPARRIMPSSRSSQSVAQPSSTSSSGSGQWIW
jgi:hypothetical protein